MNCILIQLKTKAYQYRIHFRHSFELHEMALHSGPDDNEDDGGDTWIEIFVLAK